MATIPVVTQRQVLPDASPLPFTPVSVVGDRTIVSRAFQRTGQQIATAGEDLVRAFEKIQKEDDDREFSKLATEHSTFLRLQAFGDGTAENPGYLNMQGENAVAAYQKAQQRIAKETERLQKMASNRNVKDRFTFYSADQNNSMLTRFSDHAADERRVANEAVAQARIGNSVLNASSFWADPNVLAQELAAIESTVLLQSQAAGEGAEVAAFKARQARTLAIEQTVNAAIIGSTGTAASILQRYAGELDGATVAGLADKIDNKRMQDIRDAQTFDAINDENKREHENEVHRQLRARQAKGEDIRQDAVAFLDSGDIRPDQYDDVIRSYDVTPIDNIQGRTEYKTKMYFREGDIWAFRDDPTLSAKDKAALTDDAIEIERNGGFLNSKPVQDAYEQIATVVGGGRDPITKQWIDFQAGERAIEAINEFNRVLDANPDKSQAAIFKSLDDVLNRWRGTIRLLNTYPKPYGIPQTEIWPPATPKEAGKRAKLAEKQLIEDRNSGDISKDEFDREYKNLEKIAKQLQNMMQTTAGNP